MDRAKQLGEEKISKLLITFSVPAIIGMLVSALYNVVDRIFIGNAPDIGKLGIAGITIGMPIMIFMMALGMLMGIGGSSLAALRMGEGKQSEAEHIMGNAIIGIVVLTLACAALGLIFLDPLLSAFGASDNILPYAKDYMGIILLGSIFSALGMCLNAFIRVDGQPKVAMKTMMVGALINAILDPLFIFGFHWGIQGAALATILSQFASMAWTIHYFTGTRSRLKIHRKHLVPDLSVINHIVIQGLPSFLMQIANTVVSILLNVRLSQLGGDIAISGIGIINSLQMLMIMPVLGINQGAQPIIGFNYGAKKYHRVKETLRLAIIASTAISTLGFLIAELFPGFLISLFNRDAELMAFATFALRVMFIMVPCVGFQIITSSYFQSIGKPKIATLLTLSRQVIVLIPAILILSSLFGVKGVVFATPLADGLAVLLTASMFIRDAKGLNRMIESAA